jgi:hypothetical protein
MLGQAVRGWTLKLLNRRGSELRNQQNKLARTSQLRQKPNAGVDNGPSMDQQLARIDEDLRRLKIEFDIYFNGAAKRPPYDTKSRVDTMLKRLGDDRSLTFAQRYLYNSLVSRYTAFKEVWRRTMKNREEGRDPQQAHREAARKAAGPTIESATFICADARSDVDTVKGIYAALIQAKKLCNEPVDDISFPKFHHMIATRTDNLKQHLNCDRVKFSIGVEDGKVSFKARAEKE